MVEMILAHNCIMMGPIIKTSNIKKNVIKIYTININNTFLFEFCINKNEFCNTKLIKKIILTWILCFFMDQRNVHLDTVIFLYGYIGTRSFLNTVIFIWKTKMFAYTYSFGREHVQLTTLIESTELERCAYMNKSRE